MQAIRRAILTGLKQGAVAWTPRAWSALAARLHAAQVRENPVYRAWVRAHGKGKRPCAMPVAAWREARVFCGRGRPGAVFESSGTTSASRGRHFFRDLAIYEASVVAGWSWAIEEWSRRGIVSSRAWGLDRAARFVALMPSPRAAPRSSLSRMLEILGRRFGGGAEFWPMRGERGEGAALARRLGELAEGGDAVVIFGTAFGWVHFLDACAAHRRRLRLGRRALAIETGGYKGRTREVPREELHRTISWRLGIPRPRVRVEYSMCEISSQAWSVGEALRFPPWCRARVVPPLAGGALRKGEPGVLEVHDLANTDSCGFVRTEDLAVEAGGGFVLAGRAPRAGLKGCSLAHEGDARFRAA